MSEGEIESKIWTALSALAKNDALLLSFDVNERSITHKLAQYLEPLFRGYDVDCEYNRVGTERDKKILHRLASEIEEGEQPSLTDTDAKTVFPDIIVHIRGGQQAQDNLLVIEAKKAMRSSAFDLKKLKAYKHELGYRYAYSVVFAKVGASFLDSTVTAVI